MPWVSDRPVRRLLLNLTISWRHHHNEGTFVSFIVRRVTELYALVSSLWIALIAALLGPALGVALMIAHGNRAQHRPDTDLIGRTAQIEWNGGIETRLFESPVHLFEDTRQMQMPGVRS